MSRTRLWSAAAIAVGSVLLAGCLQTGSGPPQPRGPAPPMPCAAARRRAPPLTVSGDGFIGDGESHPLSGLTTCAGRATSGWTLAQWQEFLPTARSLADEVDGLAIHAYIDAQPRPQQGVQVILPPCVALLSRPIVTGAGPLKVHGAGQFLSQIVQTTAVTDGNGDLTVALPEGVFALAPVVLAMNGDRLNGPTETVVVVRASVTNKGFAVHFGGSSGVPRRVNWQATGR